MSPVWIPLLAVIVIPESAGNVVLLLGSFGLLLIGAELFTNGVEWLGRRLGVSESATGSILAAVGTALPETLIPVLAILQGVITGNTDAADEIGVGAILGAPFLLSTVAVFLIGASVLYYADQRTHSDGFHLDNEGTRRDLSFFLAGYSLAVIAALVPSRMVDILIAFTLMGLYGIYLYRSLHSGTLIENDELDDLYFGMLAERVDQNGNHRSTASNPSRTMVLGQTFVALVFIVGGAQLFVTEIEFFSEEVLTIPAAVVTLLVAPFATELPEKINSVLWISNDKDTLAMGNITGAMAFQGTVPVTLGILFTSWNLSFEWGTAGFLNAFSAVLALLSAGLLYLRARSVDSGTMRPLPFLFGGIVYLLFVAVVFYHLFVLGIPSTG